MILIISAVVEYVKYRNDENGYSIVVVDCDGVPECAVGNFPSVSEGDRLELEGEFVLHPKYGRQFKVSGIKYGKFDTPYAIIKYLASGVVKGVRESTAAKLVDKFGARTIEIIENNPEMLTQVKGISLKKAMSISQDVIAASAERDAFMYLMNIGLTVGLAMKIYQTYKSNTVAVVESNPYRLVEDITGVGFLTADEIAKKAGIEADSKFRMRAALVYALRVSAERDGNTGLPKDELMEATQKLVGAENTAHLSDALDSLLLERAAVDADGLIMLSMFYRAEKNAALRLVKLLESSNKAVFAAENVIDEYERINGIKLNSDQKAAVLSAVNSGVSVITGGPGTGKTTIIKCIIYILSHFNLSFSLLAPTGRAAKRMEESTGYLASTIHRAILAFPNSEEKTQTLNEDVVIVDEFSMVDAFLFNMLLSALKPEAKLIIVGDSDQLPSVGAGNVLKDIMDSGAVCVTRLNTIYRQEGESLIVTNAHKINSGEMPILDSKDGDFFYFPIKSPERIADMTVDLVVRRITEFRGYESASIQTLCPMKNGLSGVHNLNARLQDALNPKIAGKRELVFGDTVFRVGDRVMHTVNNYELEWSRGSENGAGVFNGDSGVVQSISNAGELVIRFDDGRECLYTGDNKKQIILSYAITVHKSQGSEFDVVVLPIYGANPVLMTRNLLYTAITRAKKMVVLVGDKYHISRMVENDYIAKRYSKLKDFISDTSGDFERLFGS